MFAILASVWERIGKDHTNRNITFLSDSQAALRAIEANEIKSKLVCECRESLMKVAEHNTMLLVWVPGQ